MRKILLTPFLLLPLSLNAQQRTPPPAAEHDAALPVTHVSLYKNGVGFFEHTGHVTGNAAVTLSFNSGQLNDVLQSLTAIDLNGGRISGAGYNSTTPLDQQLKNLPITLAENPTAADFYTAIRGARVEVRSGTATINGRLLSVETRSLPTKADDASTSTDRYFITVVADSGEVRTLELTQSTSVRLTETNLHTDVTRYLQLLDSNRSQGLRHLTIEDHGTGQRELKVSYISEVPIWKSTYRILFTDANKSTSTQTATLQGWSVVDNTTGTDWTNVQLSLIAGAPQSFIQPLSQPIYSRRPEIPIAQEAQLTPQTFESSIDGVITADKVDSLPINGRGYAGSAGVAGGLAGFSSNTGIGPGSGGNTGGGVMHGNASAVRLGRAAAPAMKMPPAPPPPPSYEDEARESLQTNTQTTGFDDFFAYNLTEPVTILKNESALVPILQTKVTADRVTLVTSNGSQTSQPLRALWITNTSGLTLDRGSFTIVENGNFGGEGLLDPIHPDEKRLLSYAADQAVRVSTEGNTDHTERVDHVTASKGVIILHRAEIKQITYVVHNSASEARTIVLEHPIDKRFELTSDTKPAETTATVYRFRLTAAPGETVKLPLTTKHRGIVRYELTRSDEQQIQLILNDSSNNPQVAAVLAPILEARRLVADAQTAVDQTNTRLTALHADEERQRANITALATADKASRDRFVRDLNTTEDNIKSAQTELAQRTTTLDAAKADLANRIQNLQLDTTI